MVSDPIQKQIDSIQEQGYKRLEELSVLILLLEVPLVVECWFGSFMTTRLILLHLPVVMGLYFCISILVTILILFVGIIYYFWRLRSKAQFHVVFIEGKEERRRIDTKRFVALLLIPASISIGLSFTTICYAFYVHFHPWWSLEHTLWWSFGHTPLLFLPLILVVCSSVFFYSTYRIKPERVQRSIPWLFFIPITLSISWVLLAASVNTLQDYSFFLNKTAPVPGSLAFTVDIMELSFRALFLASFILLFYCTHYVNKYGNFYTYLEGKNLRGLVEEGVAILPERVRAGESYRISFDVELSKDFTRRLSFMDDPYKSDSFLEAELQAPGLNIDSEKRLRIHETSSLPIITWTCHFPTSGIQTINLVINEIRLPDYSRHVIFMQEREVKVDSFLSISGELVLTVVTPILIAVAQVLLKLQ